jgi:hypothetical protein
LYISAYDPIINSEKIPFTNFQDYKGAFLLVRHQWVDNMTGKIEQPPMVIFQVISFTKNNTQFTTSVHNSNVESIRNYLQFYDKKTYDMFFK